jgi:hypothetical protein
MNAFNLSSIAAHWYCWHEIPFDTDYPDYFPGNSIYCCNLINVAKPGFKEAVSQLQSIGYKIFPYINGRLYDYNAETWDSDNAAEFCAKRAAPR